MKLAMEPLDERTFTRAMRQMREARDRGVNSRLLDAAYFAGGALANGDRERGTLRSAAEVIEKVMTIGAAEIDTVAAALAGYYERLQWWAAHPPT